MKSHLNFKVATKILVCLLFLALPKIAGAGIVNNTTPASGTAEDSVTFTFSLLDTLGNSVARGTGDSLWVFSFYPGGGLAAADSCRILSDAKITYRQTQMGTKLTATYAYSNAIGNLDGAGENGTFAVLLRAYDSTLALTTECWREFQLVTQGNYASLLDSGAYSSAAGDSVTVDKSNLADLNIRVASDDTIGADLLKMRGVAQSAIDLTDFADAGYDPSQDAVEQIKYASYGAGERVVRIGNALLNLMAGESNPIESNGNLVPNPSFELSTITSSSTQLPMENTTTDWGDNAFWSGAPLSNSAANDTLGYWDCDSCGGNGIIQFDNALKVHWGAQALVVNVNADNDRYNIYSDYFPLDSGMTYLVGLWAKFDADAGDRPDTCYLGILDTNRIGPNQAVTCTLSMAPFTNPTYGNGFRLYQKTYTHNISSRPMRVVIHGWYNETATSVQAFDDIFVIPMSDTLLMAGLIGADSSVDMRNIKRAFGASQATVTLFDSLTLDQRKVNIASIHGDTSAASGVEGAFDNQIDSTVRLDLGQFRVALRNNTASPYYGNESAFLVYNHGLSNAALFVSDSGTGMRIDGGNGANDHGLHIRSGTGTASSNALMIQGRSTGGSDGLYISNANGQTGSAKSIDIVAGTGSSAGINFNTSDATIPAIDFTSSTRGIASGVELNATLDASDIDQTIADKIAYALAHMTNDTAGVRWATANDTSFAFIWARYQTYLQAIRDSMDEASATGGAGTNWGDTLKSTIQKLDSLLKNSRPDSVLSRIAWITWHITNDSTGMRWANGSDTSMAYIIARLNTFLQEMHDSLDTQGWAATGAGGAGGNCGAGSQTVTLCARDTSGVDQFVQGAQITLYTSAARTAASQYANMNTLTGGCFPSFNLNASTTYYYSVTRAGYVFDTNNFTTGAGGTWGDTLDGYDITIGSPAAVGLKRIYDYIYKFTGDSVQGADVIVELLVPDSTKIPYDSVTGVSLGKNPVTFTTQTVVSGLYTVDLIPNSNIIPHGSRYRVSVYSNRKQVYSVVINATGTSTAQTRTLQ